MVGYLIAGALLLALILAARLWSLRRRLAALTESMEEYLHTGASPSPYSLREDMLAPVENAAADLENRVAVLSERLREENERTSSLTADISHQLKTPLASLRLFCELDAGDHMDESISQIERMEQLIGRLLRLEKLCADGYEFCFEMQDIRVLVEKVWQELSPLWPDRRFFLTGEAAIRCDGKWLGEAFGNLLKNACEHTAGGGSVTVRLEQTERAFYASVEDDGGGVPPSDLPHLFERFYRSGSAAPQGAGLGLAIAREILLRHHGTLRASNGEHGLRLDMEIPILPLIRK